jgi:hydroxylamine reductase
MNMFCYQCQETSKNKGCTIKGVCGKPHQVANLQDLLIYITKGISIWALKARELGLDDEEVGLFIAEALFSTVTNVNFDSQRMLDLISQALKIRDKIKNLFLMAYKEKNREDFKEELAPQATYYPEGITEDFTAVGSDFSLLSEKNEDLRSLKELLVYGLKGISAYTEHAYILGQKDSSILVFLQEALAATVNNNLTIDDLTGLVLKAGKFALRAMRLLDKANTSAYGNPQITQVYTGIKQAPAILVSGHDLLDLEEILKQTEGRGINIYSHCEMLPAHAYPGFKKYKHFIGNYGTSWYNQQEEFAAFGGAIVITTNCLQRPKESYKDRIFTTGLVGWPGIRHIPHRVSGKPKDFSAVIKKALALGKLKEVPGKNITIGFGHKAVMAIADKIVEAVKSGNIRRFFVMAGCDGRHKERRYFTELAKMLPRDTVILTAGCAKYRYNMLELGEINGIPRILDAGQCNDCYSLIVIAQRLGQIFGTDNINGLPISFDIAWYEQKAVCVLLALLYLGINRIRLGPTLPAFICSNLLKILVERFNIKSISTVGEDLEAMLKGT